MGVPRLSSCPGWFLILVLCSCVYLELWVLQGLKLLLMVSLILVRGLQGFLGVLHLTSSLLCSLINVCSSPLSKAGRGWLYDTRSVAPQQDSLEAEGQCVEGEDGAHEGSVDSRAGCRGPSVNIWNSL